MSQSNHTVIRWQNRASVFDYLQNSSSMACARSFVNQQRFSKKEQICRYVEESLRKPSGFTFKDYYSNFKSHFTFDFRELLPVMLANQFLLIEDRSARLLPRGALYLDSVLDNFRTYAPKVLRRTTNKKKPRRARRLEIMREEKLVHLHPSGRTQPVVFLQGV